MLIVMQCESPLACDKTVGCGMQKHTLCTVSTQASRPQLSPVQLHNPWGAPFFHMDGLVVVLEQAQSKSHTHAVVARESFDSGCIPALFTLV